MTKLLTVSGSVYDDTVKPIAEETVPTDTASIHKKSIDPLLLPLDCIPSEDDSPSGKLEMKIAAKRTTSIDPPSANEIPSAIFSGMFPSLNLLVWLNRRYFSLHQLQSHKISSCV